ncbi:hypothetical protein [Nocardia seriolae]|uniref:Uncharacterized protein n=1 Tax=Nocardia seriolae TaxID=37332 RepID=A0A0B8NL99_9NOCA|nr:hypothetical protein [Nocardia seriolae]APB00596.1 hypothetical protein NS506_06565 [Nocardia seriolae]MTJ61910.1 hypothetical protein [Nocardia seriolae]MTJ74990.1 hypothetical protein [Nocardia seriolae]MTJ90061.1 hypothetical protein [Nocardia seriolae]MTK34034.1 hypothetical protein [Nocardia seriolae]
MFDNLRLERKVQRLERKIDLILEHLGIPDPSAVSDYTEIDELLRRGKKIQAIKLYRDLDPTASLVEAKDSVEARDRRRGR